MYASEHACSLLTHHLFVFLSQKPNEFSRPHSLLGSANWTQHRGLSALSKFLRVRGASLHLSRVCKALGSIHSIEHCPKWNTQAKRGKYSCPVSRFQCRTVFCPTSLPHSLLTLKIPLLTALYFPPVDTVLLRDSLLSTDFWFVWLSQFLASFALPVSFH